ncbi:MAG: ribbon-helix-helix protein, CopG family [Chloroflexi bacterium]|nr:ribbon-helix-helix protein, CopG family [Chloroflexota bacterium]
MYRTQIQLREDQAKTLKEMAAEYNVSVAELIRQSVDMLIQSDPELTQAENANAPQKLSALLIQA